MYHEVTDTPERQKKIRTIDPSYSLAVQEFEEQMAYLHDHGYQAISPAELIRQPTRTENACLITFDDGHVGNYEFAFPVLQKYQFTATFFVTVRDIAAESFMSWNQLRELSRYGFSIQSHTMTHPALEELDDDEIYYELAESKKIIEEKVGTRVDYLSLPLGSGKKSVYSIAREIGYVAVFNSSLNAIDMNSQPAKIGRIAVKDSHDLTSFKNIITGNQTSYYRMKIDSLIKNGVKKIVGINNYRKIYRFVYRIRIQQPIIHNEECDIGVI